MGGTGPPSGPPAAKRSAFGGGDWPAPVNEGRGEALPALGDGLAPPPPSNSSQATPLPSGSSREAPGAPSSKTPCANPCKKGPHELSLAGEGLLSSRVGLEFADELLAGRYLAGRCTLSANALNESKLYRLRYLLRTSLAVVVDPHGERSEQEGYQQQNAPNST